jgi:hypothetical protein
MGHGQVKKPRIFQLKPVRWPHMAFGHLTDKGQRDPHDAGDKRHS